jgi:hypothetical protein
VDILKTLLGGAFTVHEEGDISEWCSRFGIHPTTSIGGTTQPMRHRFCTTVDGAVQCERCGLDWKILAAQPGPGAWDQLWADSSTYQRALAPPIEPGDTRRRCPHCTWPFGPNQDIVLRRCLRCGADLQ